MFGWLADLVSAVQQREEPLLIVACGGKLHMHCGLQIWQWNGRVCSSFLLPFLVLQSQNEYQVWLGLFISKFGGLALHHYHLITSKSLGPNCLRPAANGSLPCLTRTPTSTATDASFRHTQQEEGTRTRSRRGCSPACTSGCTATSGARRGATGRPSRGGRRRTREARRSSRRGVTRGADGGRLHVPKGGSEGIRVSTLSHPPFISTR
jgi:hypothetical protein